EKVRLGLRQVALVELCHVPLLGVSGPAPGRGRAGWWLSDDFVEVRALGRVAALDQLSPTRGAGHGVRATSLVSDLRTLVAGDAPHVLGVNLAHDLVTVHGAGDGDVVHDDL